MQQSMFGRLFQLISKLFSRKGSSAGSGTSSSESASSPASSSSPNSSNAKRSVMLSWGQKLQPLERRAVVQTADRVGVPPSDLMDCIAFESAETFSPKIRNAAGSGATGLIQFMPSTAVSYFHSPEELARMSAAEKKAAGLAACDKLAAMSFIEQLAYVERYFQPYKGRIKDLGDLYLAILWPRGIGKDGAYVLWSKESHPTTYSQNAGLDRNQDGTITRAEAVEHGPGRKVVKGTQLAALVEF